MGRRTTRDALLEEGALLFARHGVGGVSVRQLHEAAGARNESALHYHFGGRAGLATEIVLVHLRRVDERRAAIVADLVATGRTGDPRQLARALIEPLTEDLTDPIGRAHLRLIAQLNHPRLAYAQGGFESIDAAAGATVVGWLRELLGWLPAAVQVERLAALHGMLVSLLGLRGQLIDDGLAEGTAAGNAVFVQNLLDIVVAALAAPPSPETIEAAARRTDQPRSTTRG